MAAKLLVPADEDEFIDMEITSFSNFLLSQTSSAPNPNSPEFKFQMSFSSSSSSSFLFQHSSEAYSSTSPADELFYKGKLLPLHLPPRLQMVQQLLLNEKNHSSPVSFTGSVNDSIWNHRSQSNNNQKDYSFDHEFYNTPLITSSYSTPITVTSFESCNASPNESFRVCDDHEMLNPEEEEEHDDFVDVAGKNQKKEEKKKMKKQQKKKKKKQYFSLVSKLRAWFGKASCKYELTYVTKKVADEGSVSKARESNNLNHLKQNEKVVGKIKYPFGQIIQRSDRNRFGSLSSRIELRSIDIDDERGKGENNGSNNGIIRSSSLVSNKLCFNGSSSFSGLPNKSLYGSCEELEIGNLIMGAIAHCKQSHLISSTSISNL